MFNCLPRPDLEVALRNAAADFAALPTEKQAEVFRAQRRSFVIAEAGFGSDQQEAEYAQAVADGDAEKIGLSVFRGWNDLRNSSHADQPQRLKGLRRSNANPQCRKTFG